MSERQISPEEEVVIRELYAKKGRYEDTNAYVTTTIPLKMSHWNGKHPVEENTTYTEIPAGSTLKIVMVSRFGDCGLTDDMTASHGYGLRVDFASSAIKDVRWNP